MMTRDNVLYPHALNSLQIMIYYDNDLLYLSVAHDQTRHKQEQSVHGRRPQQVPQNIIQSEAFRSLPLPPVYLQVNLISSVSAHAHPGCCWISHQCPTHSNTANNCPQHHGQYLALITTFMSLHSTYNSIILHTQKLLLIHDYYINTNNSIRCST